MNTTTTTTTGTAAFTLTVWEVHCEGKTFVCHTESEAVGLSSKLGHARCRIVKMAIHF